MSDVSPELFRVHSRALITAYWRRLVACGVDGGAYPIEVCWERFCRGGGERWIWLFVVIAALPIPAKAVQYFHDQTLAFIECHGDYPVYELKSLVCIE